MVNDKNWREFVMSADEAFKDEIQAQATPTTPTVNLVLSGKPASLVALLREMTESASRVRRRPRLNDEQAAEVRRRAAMGESRPALAESFNVSAATIRNLLTGKTYNEGK